MNRVSIIINFHRLSEWIWIPYVARFEYLPEVDEPADSRKAWEFINDTLESGEKQVVILSLGGLTNIAKVLELNPKAKLQNIERIVIMGGAIDADGNVAALNITYRNTNNTCAVRCM